MKHRSTFIILLILAATVLSLSSCSKNTKKALGLDHSLPDESNISQRQPLYIPPDFNLLPPQENDQLNKEEEPTNQSSKDKKLEPSKPKKAIKNKKLTDSDKKFIRKFHNVKRSNKKHTKKNRKTRKKKISKVSYKKSIKNTKNSDQKFISKFRKTRKKQ